MGRLIERWRLVCELIDKGEEGIGRIGHERTSSSINIVVTDCFRTQHPFP